MGIISEISGEVDDLQSDSEEAKTSKARSETSQKDPVDKTPSKIPETL